MRIGRKGHPEAFKATVVEAIHAGVLTLREVAEAFGLSTATVCKWKREAGLPARKGGVPTCHPDRKVYAKGLCRNCYSVNWYKAA